MKKRLFTLCLALTAMCASTMAQFITEENFPDPNFRKFLIENIDGIKGDRFLSDSEKSAVTELNVSNQGIKDLTGIEYFTKLEILFCYGNDISSANMTKLVNLLPETDYAILVVNYVGCNPDNVITKAQAKIAEDKGWIVYRCLNDEDFELYDGEDISLTTATFFPDANFRSCLAAYDTNGDNVLSETELGKVNEINVAGKGITDLTGIEHFYNLLTLNCSNNSLTALDVWNNKYLETLDCSNNNLTALDLSNNQDLAWLACYGNNISGTAMDRLVTSLPQIRPDADDYGFLIVCNDQCDRDNTITTAQIKTAMGKDWRAWQYVGSDFTDMLIKVSVAFDSDANFRAYVASNIDTDGDGYLSIDERKAVKILDVSQKSISNLSDVKYFTELTELDCGYNNLTQLNVRANKKLRELYCQGNSLTSLDITKNTKLSELYCFNNSLTSLDITNNTALTELWCYNNSLTSLIVLNNTALTELVCYNNSLTSLDVSKNTALTGLDCDFNSLTSLDVSKNTVLRWLYCYGNQISGAAMTQLVNSLRSLPSGTNGSIYVCDEEATTDNVITASQVRVATGKGWKVKKYDGNGKLVDYAGVFEPVAIDETNFPDPNFRNYLLAQDYGKDAVLTEEEMLAITGLRVPSKGIKNLKGIEYFMALTYLDCGENSLKSLDVSNNTALTELYCGINSLESLDVSNNTALTYLDCSENSLKSLDVSNNTALTKLYCGINSLESLDVSKNTALTELDCSDNSLKSLDVTKNTALTTLSCIYIGLTSLDVSNNKALTRLYCSFNSLKSLDVSKNTLLKELYCYGNQISGEAMTNLVNSLPTLPSGTEGFLVVCDVYNDGKPDNIITASQVKVAIDKRWKVYNISYTRLAEYAGQGDVNLDNKINKDDLDKLVEIIMRLAAVHGYFASDLNNDGKTDAADIVVMNNILKSLGK